MRFREIVRFEILHHATHPATWLYPVLLIGITLLIIQGGGDPAVGALFNSPIKTANFFLFVGLLGTLVTAALFVEAAHRDTRWRMDALFYTAPVTRVEYLGGRFAGTFAMNAIVLLGIPVALLVGAALPAITREALGPFRFGTYARPYVLFLLPNLLVNASLLFGLTVLTRRSLPGYLGALGLLVGYLVAANAAVGLDESPVAALLDPTGAVALASLTDGWTRIEQNTRPIPIEGFLLWNRLLWTTVALGLLTSTVRRFRFAHGVPQSRPLRARPVPLAAVEEGGSDEVLPVVRRGFGGATRARQTFAVARLGFRQTALSVDFMLVSAGLAALALVGVTEMMNDGMFGMRLWPLTQEVTADLTGRLIQLVIALLTIFYAGELVWRAREARIDQIGDSLPVPDVVLFLGQLLALAGMLALWQAVLMGAGILGQALQGYYAFQPAVYLQVLFGLALPDYLLFAVVALLAHILVNQKYVAHMAAALVFLATQQAGRFGVQHTLLIYGSDAGSMYSDLNGLGPFLEPYAWFKAYWTGWAALLAVAAVLFWVRGSELDLSRRLRTARRRFTPRVGAAAAGALLLVLVTGGFILYNTNVLNAYRTAWDVEAADAEYERRYKAFERLPQPWLTGMRLHVDIDPDERRLAVRGTYRLVNQSGDAIPAIHLSSWRPTEVTVWNISFDRPATSTIEDAAHGYRVYAFEQPLQPGEAVQLQFDARVSRRGFKHREPASVNSILVGEFTHGYSWLLLPSIGYQPELELSSDARRRAHGLPPAPRMPSLEDAAAARQPRLSPHSDWIQFEGTVATALDHTAVLPGALERTWVERGRRYFHYRAEQPIKSGFAFISGRFALHQEHAEPAEIRVLHHPAHTFNVDRMTRNVRASFDYFTREFGPYPFRHFSMVEFPRYDTFGRAYPGMMLFSENHPIAIARIAGDKVSGIDGPLLVTAHEVAHQWWGHQVIAANVEGAGAMTETLAQYSALMVLERVHGRGAARPFVRVLHTAYLESRGTHATPEVPLLRTTDHEYLHYRKGAVVMYALRDYLGEDRVNQALAALVQQHAYQGPPYATTEDLYRELKAVAPASLHGLLEDLLATVTLWDLRATAAHAAPCGSGEYRVTLEVEAAKLRADGAGNETEVPMDDLVDIVVFPERGEPLYAGKHRIRSGRQEVTITVSGKPARAGIDPYHTLITRQRDALIYGRTKVAKVTVDGSSIPAPDRASRDHSACSAPRVAAE